ncbi:MAG: neutral/alkaline non-lysosomal ceramidase N-terminal domain-containing protein [Bacteroidota bacterium]
MRKILKIVSIIIISLFVLVFFSIDKISFKPYFETEHYAKTIEAFKESKNVEAEGKLYAGFSSVNITPDTISNIPLAGFGNREGKEMEGVHDSTFAKSIAIQVEDKLVVMCSVDMLIIPLEVSENVYSELEKYNISSNQVYFSATHTHSGIGSWGKGIVGEMFAGAYNELVVDKIVKGIVKSISGAISDLKASSFSHSGFEAPQLVKNRLVGDKGEENSGCSFLYFRQDNGKTAIISSFSAHPTVLGGSNMLLSADYPGYLQRKLEGNGVDMAMFFAGGVGSHGPEGLGDNFAKAEYIGNTLADSVLLKIKNIEVEHQVKLKALTAEVFLPKLKMRLSDDYQLSNFWSKKLLDESERVYVQSLVLSNFVLITTPADFSGELALNISNSLYKKGYYSVISSFNGDYIGYAVPLKYYHLQEYETHTMSWYGPYMGEYFSDVILRLSNGL